jgi:tetratricopeptide (TPR) repeat protein
MSAHRTRRALPSDYLSAYLDLAWQTDLEAGLRTWVEAFQRALDEWQDDECRRLLREIKAAPLDPEVEGLARYVEGRWAEQRGDFSLAVRCYQASLALNRASDHLLRQAQVLGDLGLAYRAMGRLSDALDSLQAALDIYRAAGETEPIVEALSHVGSVHTDRGQWEQARLCFDEGLAMAATPEDRSALLVNVGVWHQAQGQFDAARQCLADALSTYRQASDRPSCARVLNNLGLLALEQRRLDDARSHLTEALALNQSLGDWPNMARVLGNLTLAAQAEGNLPDAIQHCTQAIESVREIGDARAEGIFLNLRGLAYADLGDWESARADHEQSLALARKSDDRPATVGALNNLGTAHRHLEQLDKARTCYQEALTLAEELGDRRGAGEVIGNLGHLYAEQDDNAQARTHYEQAVVIAEQVGDRVLESTSVLGLCMLAFEAGDLDRLQALLDRAWVLGEATRQPDVLVRASWLKGDLALLAGEQEAGFSVYAQAILYAVQTGDVLLNATLERIAIHLGYMQPGDARAACERLQAAWDQASLLEAYPGLTQWLDEQAV